MRKPNGKFIRGGDFSSARMKRGLKELYSVENAEMKSYARHIVNPIRKEMS